MARMACAILRRMPEDAALSRPPSKRSLRHRWLWFTLSGAAIIAALGYALDGNWWRALLFVIVGWVFTRR